MGFRQGHWLVDLKSLFCRKTNVPVRMIVSLWSTIYAQTKHKRLCQCHSRHHSCALYRHTLIDAFWRCRRCAFRKTSQANDISFALKTGDWAVFELGSIVMPQQLHFGIAAIDVSSSKQCAAFADTTGMMGRHYKMKHFFFAGNLHLFSNSMQPQFNQTSRPTLLPDTVRVDFLEILQHFFFR